MTNELIEDPKPAGLGTHIPALDGLRGLAIVTVMAFHQTVMVPATAFDREYVRLAIYLQTGVDLFFVLSGFLITGILYDSKQGPHYFRNFYARRFLRIFPLYYAVLVLAFVVLPMFPHPKLAKWGVATPREQLWYWAYLSNWWIALRGYGPRNGLIDLSWTLAIEEQFYLVWPLVVWLLGRRALIRVCILMTGAALATRGIMAAAGAPPLWLHMMTPARMDTLGIGAWIALQARGPRGIAGLVPSARRVALGTGLLLALLWGLPHDRFPAVGRVQFWAGATVQAAFYGALLVLAVGTAPRGRAARLFGHPVLRFFGVYSYALYLFHNPIQAMLRDTVFRPRDFPRLLGSPLPGQFLFYIAATAPAVACAWLSWHLFEGPILRLKKYFPTERSRARTRRSPAEGAETKEEPVNASSS